MKFEKVKTCVNLFFWLGGKLGTEEQKPLRLL